MKAWIVNVCVLSFLLVQVYADHISKDEKRENLGFRPVHFAAVGLPLGDNPANGGAPSTGAFKIEDGNVVGAGTYEFEPDGVDVDINLKILNKAPGAPGGAEGGGGPGAGGGPDAAGTPKPALCPVPCSQTKPTQPPSATPGGATAPGGVTPGGSTPSGSTPGGITPGGAAPTGGGGTGGTGPTQGVTGPTTGGGAAKTPPSSGGGGSDEEQALNKHNEYRRRHGVPEMKLNPEMSKAAAAYAQKLAQMGTLTHAPSEERNENGENLSMGCDRDGQTTAEATTNWYNEVCEYGYSFGQPRGTRGTGHFTQVIWKESVELGIGKADIDKNGMKCSYIVGRYKPAGNMIGDYAENVPKGSFDRAKDCTGVKRTIMKYLSPRSKIHHKKRASKSHKH